MEDKVDTPLTKTFEFMKIPKPYQGQIIPEVDVTRIGFPKPTPKKKKTMWDYRDTGMNKNVIRKHKKLILKAVPAKKKKKMTKLPKIKSLEKKLRSILYPKIKKRDKGVCISSGQTGLVGRNYQAGHYIKAELCNLIYRYDVRNINGQRSYDNLYLRGNAPAYRKGMIKKWGIKVVDEIEENYNKPLPMNFNEREYLLKLIEQYKKICL